MTVFKVYINDKQIHSGDKYNLKDLQTIPKLRLLNIGKNKLYAIAMIDPDAPSPMNPIFRNYLHWLIINNEQIIKKFTPPNPSKGSGAHRYFFILMRQSHYINPNDLKINKRTNFSVRKFIQKYNLQIKKSIYFITENK